MLTEDAIDEIEQLIAASGGAKKQGLAEALRDLQKVIAGQSVLIAGLVAQLRNKQVGDDGLNQILDSNSLKGLFKDLGVPKENPFSVTEADQACKQVAKAIANATNFADILKSVVQVAKVFI